ncbi:MAG: hypothetical protein Fur002_18590 [Anaerolineales bacterium]
MQDYTPILSQKDFMPLKERLIAWAPQKIFTLSAHTCPAGGAGQNTEKVVQKNLCGLRRLYIKNY